MTLPVVQSTTSNMVAAGSGTLTVSSVPPSSAQNRVLIVFVGFESATESTIFPTEVRWGVGGPVLTLLNHNPNTESLDNNMSTWYLLDASFPGSAQDVIVTWGASGTANGHAVCHVISGVNQDVGDWLHNDNEDTNTIGLTIVDIEGLFLGTSCEGDGNAYSAPSGSGLNNITTLYTGDPVSCEMIVASGEVVSPGAVSMTLDSSGTRKRMNALYLPQSAAAGLALMSARGVILTHEG